MFTLAFKEFGFPLKYIFINSRSLPVGLEYHGTPASMKNQNIKNHYDQLDFEEFFKSFNLVKNLVSDDAGFVLFTLMTLINVRNSPNERHLTPLANLRATFLRLLQRRLNSLDSNFSLNPEAFLEAENSLDVVARGLAHWKKILRYND